MFVLYVLHPPHQWKCNERKNVMQGGSPCTYMDYVTIVLQLYNGSTLSASVHDPMS